MAAGVYSYLRDQTSDLLSRIVALEMSEPDALRSNEEELVRIHSEVDRLPNTINTIKGLTEDQRAELFIPLFEMQEKLAKLDRVYQDLTLPAVPAQLVVDGNLELATLKTAVQVFGKNTVKMKREKVLEEGASLRGRIQVLSGLVNQGKAGEIAEMRSSLNKAHFDYFRGQLVLLQNDGMGNLEGRCEKILELMQTVVTFALREDLSGAEKEVGFILVKDIEIALQDTIAILEVDNSEAAQGYQLLLNNERERLMDQGDLLAQQLGLALSTVINFQ